MFLRKSMYTDTEHKIWIQDGLLKLQNGLVEAMSWQKQLMNQNLFTNFWHQTRTLEYPWALKVTNNEHPDYTIKSQCILDIGSNAQFHVALLGMGCEHVTAHYTSQDVDHVGLMNCWAHGWHNLSNVYKKYLGKISWLYCDDFDQLPLEDRSFDIIYCLSVIEHYPQEEAEKLFDDMWRLLAVGGKLVFTVDYFIDYPLSSGVMPFGMNHNFFELIINKYKLALDDCKWEEIPWNPLFDTRILRNSDIHISEWGQMGRLGVYCFTLTKGT